MNDDLEINADEPIHDLNHNAGQKIILPNKSSGKMARLLTCEWQ
jgi:hypothetical protein